MRRYVALSESHGKFTLLVFHAVALIDNNVLPLHFAQCGTVIQNVLIRGEYNVKLLAFKVLCEHGPLSFLALVEYNVDLGRPFFKLTHPVVDCR